MSVIALPPDQLALYIALPIISFFVIALCICCCYRQKILCFKANKNEALLSDDKVRFTVDLSKKGRKKGQALKFQKRPVTENAEANEISQELVFSPISNPSFVQTNPVGQTKESNKKQTETELLKPSIQFYKHEDSSYGTTTDGTSKNPTAENNEKNYSMNGQYSDKSQTHQTVSSTDIKPTTSFNEAQLSQLTPEQTLVVPLTSQSSPAFPLYSNSFELKKTELSHQVIPEGIQIGTEGDEMEAQITHRESADLVDGLHFSPTIGSPPKSPSFQQTMASASRRRSSMQMPIDMRQIDPKMYKFQKERNPSFDLDPSEDKPMLHFSLEHNPEVEVLTVKVIQARNLQVQDFSGTTDPYVTVCLLPGNPRKSRVHRKTTHPEFEETFVFRVETEELPGKTLEIRSYDFDQFSRDECTGLIKINLSAIDFQMTRIVDLWKPFKTSEIRLSSESNRCGDLMLALSYLPSAEKLTIAVQKARYLRAPEGKKVLPDAYVKVCILKAGQRIKKKKTSVIPSSNNPVFNQALTFSMSNDVIQSNDVRVICFVVHEFKLGHNSYLGQVELGPVCSDQEERNHWKEMLSQTANKPLARWHSLKLPTAWEEDTVVAAKSGRRKSVAVAIAQAEKLHVDITSAPLERRSFS